MNRKINKITTWLAAAIFLLALAINVKVTLDDPFMMLSEEAVAQTTETTETTETTTESRNILCEASVDCDSIAGEDSNVTCYGYDPMYSCISYPLLFKVKCDGKEHKCKI